MPIAIIVFILGVRSLSAVDTQSGSSSSSGGGSSAAARPLEYQIFEELPVGSFVADVRQDIRNLTSSSRNSSSSSSGAEDLDATPPLRHRFTFRHPSAHPYRLFSVDERRGVIRTAQTIDRETVCRGGGVGGQSGGPPMGSPSSTSSSCALTLDVIVRPSPSVVKVVVNVLDVNDHSPRFSADRLTIAVTESTLPGALFLLPTADDADGGVLGVQEYRLVWNDDDGGGGTGGAVLPFELRVTDQPDGSKDVRLRLTGSLDRERRDRYDGVAVLAVDGGRPTPKTGSVVVRIDVIDANDNAPVFKRAVYEVRLVENAPASTTVAVVRATDADAGANAAIVYGFAAATQRAHGDAFGIDGRTGVVYVRRGGDDVDYERVQVYQLTVTATDRGDGGGGAGGGSSTADGSAGIASLSGFAKVVVRVVDVNDNAPAIAVNVLTGSDAAEVRENAEPGAFVAHVAVRDADSGRNGEVECFIDATSATGEEAAPTAVTDAVPEAGRRTFLSSSSSLFRLEQLHVDAAAAEYKITTAAFLDREYRSTYSIALTCRDRGEPTPLTSRRRVDVRVLDENDNSPTIQSPPPRQQHHHKHHQHHHHQQNGSDDDDDAIIVHIRENSAAGTHVTTIAATDADEGRNAAIVYRLAAASLVASTADDDDETANGEDVLIIDSATGRVTTAVGATFDHERRSAYRFVVTATDGGDEPRSTNRSLILMIVDVDDERPRFERVAYFATVAENRSPGDVVGRVTAVDADLTSAFRVVRYAIVGRDDADASAAFDVDAETGEISTTRRLDRETRSVYTLTVTASSSNVDDSDDLRSSSDWERPLRRKRRLRRRATAKMTSSVNVTVQVEDVNDCRPQFLFPVPGRRPTAVEIFPVPSSSSSPASNSISDGGSSLASTRATPAMGGPVAAVDGTLVARLVATDDDEGANAELRYAIAGGNDAGEFRIDALTGVITISGELQPSTSIVHLRRLVVTAHDGGVPPLMSVAELDVLVNNSLLLRAAAAIPSIPEVKERGAAVAGVNVGAMRLDSGGVVVVVGSVVAALIIVACAVLAAVCVRRRYRRRRRQQRSVSAAADDVKKPPSPELSPPFSGVWETTANGGSTASSFSGGIGAGVGRRRPRAHLVHASTCVVSGGCGGGVPVRSSASSCGRRTDGEGSDTSSNGGGSSVSSGGAGGRRRQRLPPTAVGCSKCCGGGSAAAGMRMLASGAEDVEDDDDKPSACESRLLEASCQYLSLLYCIIISILFLCKISYYHHHLFVLSRFDVRDSDWPCLC